MTKETFAFDLQPAGEDDVDFIFRLRLNTMKPVFEAVFGWDDQREREKAAEAMDHTRIVVAGGERIGVIKLVPGDNEFHLHQMQICPHFQGRGIGTALVARAMATAETEAKPLTLFVVNNTPARRLYLKLGFELTEDFGGYCRMQWQS